MKLESGNKGDSERQTPYARSQCGVQLVLFLYVYMCRRGRVLVSAMKLLQMKPLEGKERCGGRGEGNGTHRT